MSDQFCVGGIRNYYGGLVIKEDDSKFYWGLDDYEDIDFEEISETLYLELYKLRNLSTED